MQLYPSKYLSKRSLHALDGEIGQCRDFLFDSPHWTIRYLVADTRKWLPGRKVVISPSDVDNESAIRPNDPIHVTLTQNDIRESPPLKEHAPVSMHIEERLSAYYGWPTYWIGHDAWGHSGTMPMMAANRELLRSEAENDEAGGINADDTETRLRSTNEIRGYQMVSQDGAVGHLEDVVFDLQAWTIRFVVLAVASDFGGKKRAIPAAWLGQFDAVQQTVRLSHDGAALKDCPEVDHRNPLTEAQVEALTKAVG